MARFKTEERDRKCLGGGEQHGALDSKHSGRGVRRLTVVRGSRDRWRYVRW